MRPNAEKKKISTKLKSRQTLSKHKGSAQSEKKESETKHNENTGFPFCSKIDKQSVECRQQVACHYCNQFVVINFQGDRMYAHRSHHTHTHTHRSVCVRGFELGDVRRMPLLECLEKCFHVK